MPALPQPPEIDYSYTGFATGLGDGSFPGTQLDNDLAGVVTAATEVTDFLARVFRSDEKLKTSALPISATELPSSSLILATGTQTARTLADRFAASISAKDCGATGDGTSHPLSERFGTLAAAQAVYSFATDLAQTIDWAAITLSLNLASAARVAAFLDGGHYIVNASIQVPSNTIWFGPGRVKSDAGFGGVPVRIADRDRVHVAIDEVDGNKANVASDVLGGIALVGNNNSNIVIDGVYVHDCAQHGIYLRGDVSAVNIAVTGCRVEDNELGGITSSQELWHLRVINNHAKGNGTHGIGILGVARFVVIAGNTAEDNGPGSDNFTGYNSANSDIVVANNTSKGALNHGIHFGGDRVTYSGNICIGTVVGNGIRHENHDASVDNDVTIIGNVVNGGVALDGIYVASAKGVTISGNVASGQALANGVYVLTCEDFVISNNVCRGNALSGIRLNGLVGGSVGGNACIGNTERGILLASSFDVAVVGNDLRGNTADGLRTLTAGGRLLIANNIARGNGATGIRVDGQTGVKIVGNVSTGNTNNGVVAGTGSTNLELADNDLTGNTGGALATTSGIAVHFIRMEGNRGYNPVGPSAISPGASPYTYTAGPSPEVVFVTGGTVSDIKVGATTIAAATGMAVPLAPLQAMTVTYSSVPTMAKSIQ